jgi:zona occludens toxin
MIIAVQGTPGSGKSAIMVADMADFLLSGGVVAMNFSLSEQWLDLICAASFKYRSGAVDREAFRRSIYDRCFKIGTHETIMELGPKLRGLYRGKKMREGVGRLYLDEGQLIFNSRNFRENMGFIEFFTQHRKIGWDVYIITHTLDMIDKQIRGLVELESRLRNLQKVKLLGLIPLAWKPTFVTITRYAGISAGAGEIYSRRVYFLDPQFKDLYDTCEVFAFNKARTSVDHQGSYTPAPPHVSYFVRLVDRLFPNSPKKVAVKNRGVVAASCWPPYHQVITTSAPASPRESAAAIIIPWSAW